MSRLVHDYFFFLTSSIFGDHAIAPPAVTKDLKCFFVSRSSNGSSSGLTGGAVRIPDVFGSPTQHEILMACAYSPAKIRGRCIDTFIDTSLTLWQTKPTLESKQLRQAVVA